MSDFDLKEKKITFRTYFYSHNFTVSVFFLKILSTGNVLNLQKCYNIFEIFMKFF